MHLLHPLCSLPGLHPSEHRPIWPLALDGTVVVYPLLQGQTVAGVGAATLVEPNYGIAYKFDKPVKHLWPRSLLLLTAGSLLLLLFLPCVFLLLLLLLF